MEISQQRSYIQQYIGNSADERLVELIYGLIEADRIKAEKDTKEQALHAIELAESTMASGLKGTATEEDPMVTRAKAALEDIRAGRTRDIREFAKDADRWIGERSTK